MSFLPGLCPGFYLSPLAAAVVDPTVRYVGQYSWSFSAANSTTVNLPAVDLTLSGADKQLVFCWAPETVIPTRIEMDGANCPLLAQDSGGFVFMFGGYRPAGVSDITVTLRLATSGTESGVFHVYEVVDAAPLYEGFSNETIIPVLAPALSRFVPSGGSTIGIAFNATDTVTYSWSGLSEDADVDAGTYRQSVAHSSTPVVSDTRDSITITGSAGTTRAAIFSAIRSDFEGVRGGLIYQGTVVMGVGQTTATITAADPRAHHVNAGSFKLVIVTAVNTDTDITGVTFDGNAMTQVGAVANTSPSPDLRLKIWAIDVTQSDASGDIVFTGGTGQYGIGTAIFRLYGVGSVGTPGSQQGNATGASFTVDVSEGGMILAASARDTDTQTVTWTGVEEMSDFDSGECALSIGIRWNASAETGRTIQATGNAPGQYVTLAIPFNP